MIVCFIYEQCAVKVGGASVACLLLMLGFGLFGKNLLNVWCVVVGVWLYSRFGREAFAPYIDTAFFGTALGPIFSEILFSTSLSIYVSIPLSIASSLAMGFVLAPVAAHLFKARMGLSLYNIGFATGITGTVVVALYKSYGFVPGPVFIWTTGNNTQLAAMLAGMSVSMMGLGLVFDRTALRKQARILNQSGQAPTDLISLVGIGPTLMNMGFTGVIGSVHVLLIASDLNGPTNGAILTIVGFSAFGKHAGNIMPTMAGVFVGSLAKPWSISDPSVVLAALFGTSLAPVGGRFGWRRGVVARFLHSFVARSVGQLYGGLVLYNNGFAAGLVAAVLVPVILALDKRVKTKSNTLLLEL